MGSKDFDFFQLNPHRLDEEWINQPRLYFEYASKLADARQTYEQAKALRDVVTAEIDKAVRQAPEVFGLEKATESAVEKTILLQKRHRKVVATVIEAKHEVDVIEAVVRALEHRKTALENLVALQARDYFSAPKEPTAAAGQMKQAERDRAFGRKSKKRQS